MTLQPSPVHPTRPVPDRRLGRWFRPRSDLVTRTLVALLRCYRQWISPALPPTCRFSPSCSAYAIEALMAHGTLRGSWLTAGRLLRCGPWHPGGMDPVPPARPPRSDAESESSC